MHPATPARPLTNLPTIRQSHLSIQRPKSCWPEYPSWNISSIRDGWDRGRLRFGISSPARRPGPGRNLPDGYAPSTHHRPPDGHTVQPARCGVVYRENLRRAVGSPKAFARVIQKPSLSTLSCTAKIAVLRMCVLGWPP